MNTPRIIGLTGKAGAGKDTAARILVGAVGPRHAVMVALADPLKRFCMDMFGFRESQLWGSSERRSEPPPGRQAPAAREALQTLGTEWGRRLDEDVWIRRLLDTAALLLDDPSRHGYVAAKGVVPALEPCAWELVVVPDVRFPNEASAIRQARGEVWEVRRHAAGLSEDAHESEAGLPSHLVDRVLENDGDPDLLWRRVRQAWRVACAPA